MDYRRWMLMGCRCFEGGKGSLSFASAKKKKNKDKQKLAFIHFVLN